MVEAELLSAAGSSETSSMVGPELAAAAAACCGGMTLGIMGADAAKAMTVATGGTMGGPIIPAN